MLSHKLVLLINKSFKSKAKVELLKEERDHYRMANILVNMNNDTSKYYIL